jgi:hypothetical protein
MASSKAARPASAASGREPQGDLLDSKINCRRNTQAAEAATVAIYDGRDCIGFVARGKAGDEAFDRDGPSKGRFPTQQDAMAALSGDTA